MKHRHRSIEVRARAVVLLALASALGSAARAADQLPLLQSVLWVQASLEYQSSAQTIYRAATARLKAAVAAPGSASLEVGAGRTKRPPALVLDIDETVLDNSRYSGWLVQQGVAYDEPSWQRWIAFEQATAVPGALAFTQAATRLGIAVFYVSNRECVPLDADPCPAKRHTMANLAALGFPRASDASAVLLKQERPEWGSDKSSRRQLIADRHRIIMLFGDDLRDFVSPADADQLRAGKASSGLVQKTGLFGQRWFMLPNPMYGSWEQALPAMAAERIGVLKTPQPPLQP